MPESTKGGAAASASSDPQAGATPAPPTIPEPGDPGTNINNPEAKKYADEAAAERKARKALEAKLAQYETAQQQADLAKLGDLERAQKQLSDYEEQLAALQLEQQQYRLAREIAKAAPSVNLIDPDAAQVLLTAGNAVEYDDKGHPTNVVKLLEQLVTEKPYLVASNVTRPPMPPSSGGATNPARNAQASTVGAQATKPDAKAMADAYAGRRGLASRDLWKR